MLTLLGYLGAAAIGAAIYLLIAAVGARRVAPASVSAELGGRSADLRERDLDRSLFLRTITPVVGRLRGVARRAAPGGRNRALRARLEAGGLAAPLEAFYAAKLVMMGAVVALTALVLLIAGDLFRVRTVLLLAVAAGIGYLLPEVWILQRAQKRQQTITRDLPEGLDLLALTVRAGLGLEQGIAEVARETSGPLGEELDRMLKEQQLGRSRREAVEALQRRNTSDDLQRFTAALLHADKLGTPISVTLQVQARELRRRRRARARERAGKAPVKLLFPLILFIFPAMFVVIIGPGILQILEALF